jgi:hypothetical protein
MSKTPITAIELHERLVRSGQIVPGDESAGRSTDVWPTPETIVTVAMNLDPTLMPSRRTRYFACLLNSAEEPIPALRDEPAFALPERFRGDGTEGPGDDAFLDGPFRWLVRRITRYGTILLWPGSDEPGTGGAFAQAGLLEEVLCLQGILSGPPHGLEEIGAVVLDLGYEPDCRVLRDVAQAVSCSFFDFLVSDPECREVYRLHHHGKVVVSIPDGSLRQELLEELGRWSAWIEDCSGYASPSDDEDWD